MCLNCPDFVDYCAEAEYDDEEVDDEVMREVDAKRKSQEATMKDLAADGY
jgi:hypothetical protein